MRKVWKGAVVAVCMLAAGIVFSCSSREPDLSMEIARIEDSEPIEAPRAESEALHTEQGSQGIPGTDPDMILVHVCGQVANPGVYEALAESRVYELIEMAGGFTPEAAKDYLNLASVVADGQQILVPDKEEALHMPKIQEGTDTAGGKDGAKVNINTADLQQLTALRGIGEARAQDIIQYRETNGGFQRIEDIMKVSGIKEAAFEKIKDQITVAN